MAAGKVDRLKELDEQGEFPTRWDPQVGDTIAGVVRRYTDVDLEKSGLTRLCVVEREDGEVETLFLSPTVLKSEFWRLKPKIGERVFVRYLGTPKGKDYKKFVVRCPDRPQEENPDWGDDDGQVIGAGTGAAPAAAPSRPQPAPDPDDPFADEMDAPYSSKTVGY
jgi:hypothetical protein